mmetsp:Transcript_55764/g.153390  ORF Transcript_55764/g.153390 Transcript_55764/m.153390 type:complete len:316 (+) Transcript_55764:133-1080(+)
MHLGRGRARAWRVTQRRQDRVRAAQREAPPARVRRLAVDPVPRVRHQAAQRRRQRKIRVGHRAHECRRHAEPKEADDHERRAKPRRVRVGREISKADGGEGDDGEVEGIEVRPTLGAPRRAEDERRAQDDRHKEDGREQHGVSLSDRALELGLGVGRDGVQQLAEALDVQLHRVAAAVAAVPCHLPKVSLKAAHRRRVRLDIKAQLRERPHNLAMLELARAVSVEHIEGARDGRDATLAPLGDRRHHQLQHLVRYADVCARSDGGAWPQDARAARADGRWCVWGGSATESERCCRGRTPPSDSHALRHAGIATGA